MLDHLKADDGIHPAERQRGQVGSYVRQRVGGGAVRDRGGVVVDRDDPRSGLVQDLRSVPFAGTGLEHGGAGAPRSQPAVDDFVPGEPVLLARDPGHGALTGQRQS